MNVLIDKDPEQEVLKAQLAHAQVIERDYTGVGVYIHFSVPYDLPLLGTSHRLIETTPKLHLMHPSLEAGAGVLLWFKDGRIDTLECYTYEGKWPKDEAKFSLTRA